MSLETNSFEFGEFLLDAKEKVLLRDGKPLAITPKAFQLLQILVENHGHLVERNELLNTIWADSFVEEGNLTFTIQLLRKALGDKKQNPRFIETVTKRGYRFIAEVKQVSNEIESQNEVETTPLQEGSLVTNAWSSRQKLLIFSVALTILLTTTIGIGSWLKRGKSRQPTAPILSAPYSLENISTTGKVFSAAISPDGKSVVYANRNANKQSVWLRQIDSAENIEIIPPLDADYYEFAFSPDGNFLYFNRRMLYSKEPTAIYRVSIQGGIPTKIISNTKNNFSLSPNGEKISFNRCCKSKDDYHSLWIADSTDGKNERTLASTKYPLRIAANQISPDGKSVAFAVGQSENEANDFSLKEVNIETGKERELTGEKFFNIKHLKWLPNQSGLLITASRVPNKHFRIWQVSAARGEVQPLTNDSENYSVLTLDKSGSHLISTQFKEDFRLQLRNIENPAVHQVLTDGRNFAFASNEKIIFYSSMTGNDEIWSINTDGSGQHQLTNNIADDRYPVTSPTDGSIFFTSNRTGEAHVWRMNADGSNQTQITHKEGGFPFFVSPDGKWVYYYHGKNRTLWRVQTNGGREEKVLNKGKNHYAISPDGTQVAFSENTREEKFLQIASLADGQITTNILIADQKANLMQIEWLPDGKNIAYILVDGEDQNYTLWLQPLEGKARKITDLGDDEVVYLKFAPDGKNFIITQGGWRHDAVLLKGLK